MPLLDDVAAAADKVRALDEERKQAREVLREKVRAARAEEIPFAVIARRAGYSREAIRKLHAED